MTRYASAVHLLLYGIALYNTDAFSTLSSSSFGCQVRSSCIQLNASQKEKRYKRAAKILAGTVFSSSAVGLLNNINNDHVNVAHAADVVVEEAQEQQEALVPAPSSVSKDAVKVLRPKRKLSLRSLLPDFTNVAKPTQSQSVQGKVGSVPVFCVCTSWGSPYMVYDENGAANALYFMDEQDAKSLLDEFLNMEKDRDARIMATTLAKAMKQAANINGVPTGQLTVDGTIQLMYYKIVPSTKELFFANKLPGRENLALTGVEDEFTLQERVVGSINDSTDNDNDDDMLMPGREMEMGNSGAQTSRQKAKKRASPYRKKKAELLEENNWTGREGIPAFFVEGMQFQSKASFLPGRSKSDTPLFLSYNDCMDAWKEMRDRLEPNDKSKVPVAPKVEVFNLIDVVASIEQDIVRRESAVTKDEKNVKTGLETIVFIPSSKSVDFVEGITSKGNGQARLKEMR